MVSVASSAAGLAFLVAGTVAEGSRETATTSIVVLGPTYLTATASASASLHFYVLTAVCLFLGFVGLLLAVPLAVGVKLLVIKGVDRYRDSDLFRGERIIEE